MRLSRRLFPDADRHNLDSVIARHALPVAGRHRALGDARVLWAFVQALYRELPPEAIEAAARRVLKTPSLPPQLPPDALDALPEAPGVYLFYGLNPLPLYVGKSRNLRERVAAHFSSDYRSATDLRLSAEIRRIEFEETAGEIGALLREAALVKALLPAHNHALRRKAESGVLELPEEPGPAAVRRRRRRRARARSPDASGRSRRAARRARRCAISRPSTRCAGRRWGSRSRARALLRAAGGALRGRLRRRRVGRRPSRAAALPRSRRHAIPPWPFAGLAAIRERPPWASASTSTSSATGAGSAPRATTASSAVCSTRRRAPEFDADIARLLMRMLARGRHEVLALA